MESPEIPTRFSRHNFENLQSLVRFADAKAGALAGLVFVLIATGSSLFQKALDKVHFSLPCWRAALGFLFWTSWAAFAVIAILFVLKRLLSVVLPRPAKHYSGVDHSAHLMYWEHVALRPDSKAYYDDVAKLDAAAELRNLTDQVYELAGIVQAKMQTIKSVRGPLIWMTLSWSVGTLSAILVILSG